MSALLGHSPILAGILPMEGPSIEEILDRVIPVMVAALFVAIAVGIAGVILLIHSLRRRKKKKTEKKEEDK